MAGDYAYVADWLSGLQIIDVSNPQAPHSPEAYDTPGDAWGTCRGGRGLRLRRGPVSSGLQIIDVSNPQAPVLAGSYDTPGWALGVAVAGDYAYVADWSGLQIIDVSNPQAPALAGSYDTPGDLAYGVAVAGDYAYVADGSSGLQVIDVSNPQAPALAASYDTPDWASGAAVAGDYAYVADAYSGLQIIDVSNPQAPALAGSYDTPGEAWGVAVAGDYAYVADAYSGLQIIDVSNPQAPALAGSYDTPDWALGVAVAGDYAYVADGYSGVQIIDVTNPQAPALAGSYDTPDHAWGVAIAGNYAYVADGYSGLQIIDVSNPQAPALAGSYDTADEADGAAVAGGYAYVADGSSGLQVIDVSNPQAPALVDSYDTPGESYGVAVAGGYAYVADASGGLQVIRPNPPLRNVSCLPGTTIHLTVPDGFNPGPYHVLVRNPGGEADTLRNGFRACERRVLNCTLQSLNDSRSPRPWPWTSSTTWRLLIEGDDVFFEPLPRHEALLRLPDLPAEVEMHEVPAKGSGRTTIELHIFPRHDRARVRLVGADVEGLRELWAQMRSAGGIALKRINDRAYGDITLSVSPNPAGHSPVGRGASRGRGAGSSSQPTTRYRYDFVDGQLTGARAFGPDADLVLEVVARDKYHCETVERISLLGVLDGWQPAPVPPGLSSYPTGETTRPNPAPTVQHECSPGHGRGRVPVPTTRSLTGCPGWSAEP